jgi:glycosyltransferase involved in cell wall biosynthesis
MSSTPIISVIMPCYNAEETIGDQLKALANQDCDEPWELLIADNGSTDNTIEVINEYHNRIPNLLLLDASQKPGPAYARNLAVKHASGKYIAYCDADDEVDSKWLRVIMQAVSKYDFVASQMDAIKLSDSRAAKLKMSVQTEGLIQYTYVPYLPHAGTSGLAIRKDLHESINGFDERFRACEDCDYCWKIQQSGTPLHFEPNALIHIRHRGTAFQRFKQAIRWGSYNVLLIKTHVPRGMPKPRWKDMYVQWKYIFDLIPKLRRPKIRDRFYWAVGYRLGQVVGSIKYRCIAL